FRQGDSPGKGIRPARGFARQGDSPGKGIRPARGFARQGDSPGKCRNCAALVPAYTPFPALP
ncbi:MAG TPA: hypothetical protein VMY42_09970, partial [Thermoguttaceae bacterium]|nr:hypothetical protein [Thermoguttaceae bacterium]